MIVETKAPPWTWISTRSLSAFSGVAIQRDSMPPNSASSTSVEALQLVGWIACIFSRTTSGGSLYSGCAGDSARIKASYSLLATLRLLRQTVDEFYQLLTYKDDVDLEKKLAVWEGFYNNDRPHGAHKGRTPYEVLLEKLR